MTLKITFAASVVISPPMMAVFQVWGSTTLSIRHMKMYQDAIAMKDQALTEHSKRYDEKCEECDEFPGSICEAIHYQREWKMRIAVAILTTLALATGPLYGDVTEQAPPTPVEERQRTRDSRNQDANKNRERSKNK